MSTSSEFRSVHAAEELLKLYHECGKDIRVIREYSAPIERHDVWMAVFEKEREAIRELQIKEFYSDFNNKDTRDHKNEIAKTVALMAVTRLNQLIEWKTPLTAKDALDIIIDALGEDILPLLIKKAVFIVNLRKEIVAPYNRKDDTWVSNAIQVLNLIKKRCP